MVHKQGRKTKSRTEFKLEEFLMELKAEDFSPGGALELALENEDFGGLRDRQIVRAVERIFKGKVVYYRTSRCKSVPKK